MDNLTKQIQQRFSHIHGKVVRLNNIYGRNYDATIDVQAYSHDQTPAIRLMITAPEGYVEPLATLTCCLVQQHPNLHKELADDEIVVKAWSENEPVVEAFMRDTDVFIDTGVRIPAGFCEAQIWRVKDGSDESE